MPGDPSLYRQRALSCANSAAACPSPAASQKFADLALVWLMLAVELEERGCQRPAEASGLDSKRETDG